MTIIPMAENVPAAIDAEKAYLSACLTTNTQAIEVGTDIGLVPDDFYLSSNGLIWKSILRLYDSKKPVETVTVAEDLEALKELDSPFPICVDLLNANGLGVNAAHYAHIIKDRSIRRELIHAAGRIAEIGYDTTSDIETVLDRAENALKKTRDKAPQQGRDPGPSDIISRLESTHVSGIQTRLPTLNQLSGGMTPSHLWVIGGFSSTGKSAFAVNMAEDVIINRGSVMIASTEMSQEQFMLRMLSLTSKVPARKIRYGGMTLEESHAYEAAKDAWQSARVRIFDDIYNMARIRRVARKVKESIGLDILVVDFLQNINETGDEIKDARLSAIQLQALAKELNICVIGMSQISNQMAQMQNEDGIGNYYNFKGSGAIKDAADLAIMLTRDRQNYPDALWCHVVKNRHDRIGRIGLLFELENGLIRQMTPEEEMSRDPNSGRRNKG